MKQVYWLRLPFTDWKRYKTIFDAKKEIELSLGSISGKYDILSEKQLSVSGVTIGLYVGNEDGTFKRLLNEKDLRILDNLDDAELIGKIEKKSLKLLLKNCLKHIDSMSIKEDFKPVIMAYCQFRGIKVGSVYYKRIEREFNKILALINKFST